MARWQRQRSEARDFEASVHWAHQVAEGVELEKMLDCIWERHTNKFLLEDLGVEVGAILFSDGTVTHGERIDSDTDVLQIRSQAFNFKADVASALRGDGIQFLKRARSEKERNCHAIIWVLTDYEGVSYEGNEIHFGDESVVEHNLETCEIFAIRD
jgi:hypothetical protein